MYIQIDSNEPRQSNTIRQVHERGGTLEFQQQPNAYMFFMCNLLYLGFIQHVLHLANELFIYPSWFLLSSCYCWSQGVNSYVAP